MKQSKFTYLVSSSGGHERRFKSYEKMEMFRYLLRQITRPGILYCIVTKENHDETDW